MQQQGQSLLDEFSWMDSLTWEEIVLREETMVPSMQMPDAVPETGLGIEPAVQPFEMDMNNIPYSTALWGFEMEQEEQPLSDERGWKGFLIGGETELVEEPRAPVVLMPDEPETRQRTEQAHQMNNISSSSMRDFEFWEENIVLPEETMVPSMLMPDAPVTGLGIEPAVQAFETDTNNITLHRAPVVLMPDEPETRQRTEQAHQLNNISSSSMRDFELRTGRLTMSPELMQSVCNFSVPVVHYKSSICELSKHEKRIFISCKWRASDSTP
ncbi:hypothetical protein POTOM_053390 [Populus tomentosa]|uniref:Uncharacterized protein n=1 Tax=Populus tomentosa TaxID=118781 RepID=A0A8X7Y5T6_POPTO|nr:hypothetical protein POTOM_053390 [Populus tomentosa]